MKQKLETLDQIRNIYLNETAPLDMRHHLMQNQLKLDTAEAISDEIEEYCEAMKEFNKDA